MGRREDKTEAARGAFGGGVFAEDRAKRENYEERPLGNMEEGKALF